MFQPQQCRQHCNRTLPKVDSASAAAHATAAIDNITAATNALLLASSPPPLAVRLANSGLYCPPHGAMRAIASSLPNQIAVVALVPGVPLLVAKVLLCPMSW
eukprot:2114783-Rhodomonas_salina.1